MVYVSSVAGMYINNINIQFSFRIIRKERAASCLRLSFCLMPLKFEQCVMKVRFAFSVIIYSTAVLVSIFSIGNVVITVYAS